MRIPLDYPYLESIECDQENNLYLLSPGRHRIYKLFSSTGYDSVQTIGGKGISNEGFNHPNKIVIANRQSVFLLDELNRRLVKFNTNLKITQETNFLTLRNQIPGSNLGDLLPISFTVGPTGELFLLNQEDLKVWKFATDGKLESTFAGLDYGAGSVFDPCDIAINKESIVHLIDCEDQSVLLYDLYGVFQYRLAVPTPFVWDRVKVYGKTLLYMAGKKLFFYNTFTKNSGPYLEAEMSILDIALNGEYMFVLFKNGINLYRIN